MITNPAGTRRISASARLVPLGHDSVGFNLHEPLRIDKTRHLDECGCRTDRSEKISVRTCRLTPRCYIEKHYPRSVTS